VSDFPLEVKREVGFALRLAQKGRKSASPKPLRSEKDFKGAAVLEIVGDDDGNTYRTAYAAKFAGVVYVLHAFQKRSTKGIATPRKEIDLIKDRLAEAKRHYAKRQPAKDTG
jgi:phage-related protein